MRLENLQQKYLLSIWTIYKQNWLLISTYLQPENMQQKKLRQNEMDLNFYKFLVFSFKSSVKDISDCRYVWNLSKFKFRAMKVESRSEEVNWVWRLLSRGVLPKRLRGGSNAVVGASTILPNPISTQKLCWVVLCEARPQRSAPLSVFGGGRPYLVFVL